MKRMMLGFILIYGLIFSKVKMDTLKNMEFIIFYMAVKIAISELKILKFLEKEGGKEK